jgi:hypothetical protein
MKTRIFFALAVALSAAPIAAEAQSTTAPTAGAPRREAAAERREAMRQRQEARRAMTPEQRAEARARAQERFKALPPEQQQFLRDQRAYSQGLREKARELRAQVTAGTLTRDAMAEQLKAYRQANRPARPAGLPARKPAP